MSYWAGLAGLSMAGAAVTAVVVAIPASKNYPIPLGTARERLATTPLPDMLRAFNGGPAVLTRDGDSLIWKLGENGAGGELRVDLAANGATTDVRQSVSLKDGVPAISSITSSRLFADLADEILAEHVDSVLGGRVFDPMKMANSAALRWQSDPAALEEFGNAIRTDMIAISEIINETSAPLSMPISQKSSARAATAPTANATQPMIHLSQ